MKNIFKSLIVALVVIGSFTSCEDSNLPIDNLYDNVDQTGSVLRILRYPSDIVNISGNAPFTNVMDYLFEVQEGDGSSTPDFKEVRVYLTAYDDQDFEFPLVDENGNEFGEQLIRLISNAEFDTLSDNNGLPQYNLLLPTQEVLDALPGASYSGPTFFSVRFELEMNDGRIWTDYNAGTTLAGPYFESPYIYTTIFLNN